MPGCPQVLSRLLLLELVSRFLASCRVDNLFCHRIAPAGCRTHAGRLGNIPIDCHSAFVFLLGTTAVLLLVVFYDRGRASLCFVAPRGSRVNPIVVSS